MNSNFDDEQIKAYASAFESGDAIWSNGSWEEVEGCDKEVSASPTHTYINFHGNGFVDGFKKMDSRNPYRVTTLKDYTLKGGEKIVWLGGSGTSVTFGQVYDVFEDLEGGVSYYDDNGCARNVLSGSWGIIPRYEQVKYIEKEEVWVVEWSEHIVFATESKEGAFDFAESKGYSNIGENDGKTFFLKGDWLDMTVYKLPMNQPLYPMN